MNAMLDPVPQPAPLHVAIIMDGNGRWAESRGLPRVAGHRAGARSVRRVVEAAPDLGIGTLTLYTFSVDNWRRPAAEVRALFGLLRETLARETRELADNGVRLRAIGRRDRLSRRLRGWGAATPVDLYRRYVSRWQGAGRLVPGAPDLPTVFERAAQAAMPTPAETAMVLDALGYLPDDLLVKIDRASMAYGLEARAPLLDPRIAVFAWSLPIELKLRDLMGMGQRATLEAAPAV